MAATFPGSVWARYANKVDLVSYWVAADANEVADEIVALETFLIATTRADGEVLAGPASGGPLAPTWRTLLGSDIPIATYTTRGTAELATNAEVQAGAATDTIVSPAGLRSDIPASPAVSRGVRLDANGHLVMPADGQAQFRTLAQANFNYMTTYSATPADHWELLFDKSHQDTVGDTATVTGENLGGIGWRGNSGAAMTNAAAIIALQNGAAGTHTPADLVFYTSPGSGDRAEAARFTKDGHLVMAASHDVNLANGRSVGIDSANERVEFYTAGYVAVMGAKLGVGTALPTAALSVIDGAPALPQSFNAEVHVGDTNTNSRILIGQDATHSLVILWQYNATPADAIARIEAFGGNNPLVLQNGGGGVGIGTTAAPSANGDKVLFMGDNTADPTMATNTAGFYGKDVTGTVEMFAIDEDGNEQQLTPHNFSGPVQPLPGVLHWSQYHRNAYMGVKKWYDMERALLALEALTGEQFIHTHALPASDRRNWSQEQRKQQRAAHQRGESFKMKSKPFWM